MFAFPQNFHIFLIILFGVKTCLLLHLVLIVLCCLECSRRQLEKYLADIAAESAATIAALAAAAEEERRRQQSSADSGDEEEGVRLGVAVEDGFGRPELDVASSPTPSTSSPPNRRVSLNSAPETSPLDSSGHSVQGRPDKTQRGSAISRIGSVHHHSTSGNNGKQLISFSTFVKVTRLTEIVRADKLMCVYGWSANCVLHLLLATTTVPFVPANTYRFRLHIYSCCGA